jgi:hypothetical protein
MLLRVELLLARGQRRRHADVRLLLLLAVV